MKGGDELLSTNHIRILVYLAKNGPTRTSKMRGDLGFTAGNIGQMLSGLIVTGKLVRVQDPEARGAERRWVWGLSPELAAAVSGQNQLADGGPMALLVEGTIE